MCSITRALLSLLLLGLVIFGALITRPSTRAAAPMSIAPLYLPQVACAECGRIGPPTSTATLAPPTATLTASALELDAVRLINDERLKAGCPAAAAAPGLMAATRAWSVYMADNNLAQHAQASWYVPYGYPAGVAENIGGGADQTYQIIEEWMASPHHRANLLSCTLAGDPSYNPATVYEMGVGYSRGYWTFGLVARLP